MSLPPPRQRRSSRLAVLASFAHVGKNSSNVMFFGFALRKSTSLIYPLECPLLALSGHRLVRCTCLLLTQSGHRALPELMLDLIRYPVLSVGGGNAAARVYFICWLGRGLAACGAFSASKTTDYRIPRGKHTLGLDTMDRRLCAAATRTWLDRGSYDHDRVSLGRRTSGTVSRNSGGVCSSQGGCHRYSRQCSRRRGACKLDNPDCVRNSR